MTRIEVPSETLLVEMGDDGLNILETTMQMSCRDESAPVECDICSKPLGKMKDVKHIGCGIDQVRFVSLFPATIRHICQ